jgi:hypothetical protein
MSQIDPVCLIHGKRWSEHEGGRCLYCCLCFKPLEPEECWADADGQKWDLCQECGESEQIAEAVK